MPGKKISDLDVYDDVNTDKSRRDLLEISKNTGTYGSPTYATNGSRKITIEQLKETLFIKDINSYNQVTTGSPTFDKQSYNGIANAGTYTLPTSVGSYEVLAIILEAELNVTVNGLGTGISDLVFTKQNETAYLIDTVYGWLPLAVNKEVNSSAFELLANKENTTLDTSPTKYPTNNLVKTYVDNLGNSLTSGLATKLTIANNLSDLTNTTQARDNLLLGATNDVTHNSITLSNTTVSTLPFIDTAKKIISATGALLGTWFQTLTADTNPVDADTIVVNDSASSFEAKKTTLFQLWSNYLLAKVQALGYLVGSGLTTNNTLKWNGSQIVNANETDNGTTITSTINRTFTSDTSPVNQNSKFVFTGANTSAGAFSFIKVALDLQVGSSSMGANAKGMLFLDGSISPSLLTQPYSQLYINSGGDIINDSKNSIQRAIYIHHRAENNGAFNYAPAIEINAKHVVALISSVSPGVKGVFHLETTNADNFTSKINASTVPGYAPIHYTAYSLRDDAYNLFTIKYATVSTGLLNNNSNILTASTATMVNGFGIKDVTNISNSTNSNSVSLHEEYIVQNVGSGTTTSGKRYRHSNVSNGVASAYIMGLYAGGVIIGNTTAVPNSSASLDLVATDKGVGLNLVANGSKPTGRKGNFLMNDTNSVLEFTTGTGANWQELAVYKFDELLQITDCNATFSTANTGVYFPFVPKCDMNVVKIYYNLQSAGTDTVRVAIYSDSSNQATTLLVQGSESTTGATTTGQRSITISSTRLLAGTRYWIAIKNDSGVASFLSKNNVYSNNITREGFTSGAFVGSPAPSSSTNAVWLGIGI